MPASRNSVEGELHDAEEIVLEDDDEEMEELSDISEGADDSDYDDEDDDDDEDDEEDTEASRTSDDGSGASDDDGPRKKKVKKSAPKKSVRVSYKESKTGSAGPSGITVKNRGVVGFAPMMSVITRTRNMQQSDGQRAGVHIRGAILKRNDLEARDVSVLSSLTAYETPDKNRLYAELAAFFEHAGITVRQAE